MSDLLFSSSADRWRAVQTRDASADGIFVYAVQTTRIYCRPNCKARLARRANVAFFDDAHAAEAAGFRACKRCKPEQSGMTPDDAAVARIRLMLQTADGAICSHSGLSSPGSHGTPGSARRKTRGGAASLASKAQVSRWHFHRKFKQLTGMTPLQYLQEKDKDVSAIQIAQPEQRRPGVLADSPARTTDADICLHDFMALDGFNIGSDDFFLPDFSWFGNHDAEVLNSLGMGSGIVCPGIGPPKSSVKLATIRWAATADEMDEADKYLLENCLFSSEDTPFEKDIDQSQTTV